MIVDCPEGCINCTNATHCDLCDQTVGESMPSQWNFYFETRNYLYITFTTIYRAALIVVLWIGHNWNPTTINQQMALAWQIMTLKTHVFSVDGSECVEFHKCPSGYYGPRSSSSLSPLYCSSMPDYWILYSLIGDYCQWIWIGNCYISSY